MRQLLVLFVVALVSCVLFVIPMSKYLQRRPYLEKAGYVPEPIILRLLSADQKNLMAENLIFKVLIKSSGPVKKGQGPDVDIEYDNIFKLLKGATRLDPYNMDAYYIAQAMVWDKKNIQEINELIVYGMQHRTWDGYLAFFAGFNSFYFLKDYRQAADMFKRAEQLTGSPLFAGLSSRYMYEAGETDLAIEYLRNMVQNARNRAVREKYSIRLQALEEVKRIEQAVTTFRRDTGILPKTLQILLDRGYLQPPLVDPYGGFFYLDSKGKPRTTSKFARIRKKEE